MKRRVITERDIQEAVARGCIRLEIPYDAIITPLAADTASARKIVLSRSAPDQISRGRGGESSLLSQVGGKLGDGGVAVFQQPGGSGKPGAAGPAASQQQRISTLGEAGGAAAAQPISAHLQKPVVAIGSDHGGFELKSQLTEHLRAQGFPVEDVGTKSAEPCDYPDFAFAAGSLVAAGRSGLGIMIDGAGIGSCMVVNKIPGIRGACCTHEFMARNAREHNNANVLTLGSRVIGLEVAKAVVDTFMRTQFAGGRHEGRVNKIMDVDRKYRRP